METQIRAELPNDADTIDRVITEAFRSAAHSSGTEASIVRNLRASGALTISLVALAEGAVVGHVAISPVTISDGSCGWFGLGPLAALPKHQGRGIGNALVRHALDDLRRHGAAGCVVLGEPHYYGRFGFRADPQLRLDGVPPEYFQALAFEGAHPRGSVSYHAAFSGA